jgi:hypothetical protein
MKSKLSASLMILSVFLFLQPVQSHAQLNFADYDPWDLGSSWTYQNIDDPSDQFTESVFDCPGFTGNPACYKGDVNNYMIGWNDGMSVTYMAFVDEDEGLIDFPDVTIGSFTDGTFMIFDDPDIILLRTWDSFDAATKSVYEIPSTFNDVVLMAWYDHEADPNFHNTLIESGLSETLPSDRGAITDLEWYARDVGKVAIRGIQAADGTGDWDGRYNVVPEPISSTLFIVGGATLGLRRFRKKFKK